MIGLMILLFFAVYLLQTANPANNALALLWMEDKLLTPDQRAQGQGHYTDAWLTDRAAMLAWKNKLATQDFVDVGGTGYLADPAQHFEDKVSHLVIDINKLSAQQRHFIFGAEQDEICRIVR